MKNIGKWALVIIGGISMAIGEAFMAADSASKAASNAVDENFRRLEGNAESQNQDKKSE